MINPSLAFLTLGIAAAAGFSACERPPREALDAPGGREAAAPIARCDLEGVWTLTETPDVARGCDAVWDPFTDAYLQVRQHDGLLEIDYVPEDGSALSCSGLPADEACAIEIACDGSTRGKDVEAALALRFDPDNDRVSGARTLEVRETGCRMTVSIEGRREPGDSTGSQAS